MAIKNTIHYCWFGKGDLPEKEKQCIETWKEFLPMYEIKRWDETNFDYISCDFAREAYENKKYAFVSDYARAKILYEYGGVYLDTDFKIIKDFTNILTSTNSFVGFERRAFIGTAIIGCEKGNHIMKELLEYYETNHFIQPDGSLDNIANVSILTDIMKKHGLILGGNKQVVENYTVYNRELFYPKKISETSFNITNETVCIHMCSNSWLTERERKRGNNKIWIEFIRPTLRYCRGVGIKLFGKDSIRVLEIKIRNKLK